jgi:hypothetical protein
VENDTIYKTNQPTDQQINMTYISQVYMHTCMMHSRDHRGSIANCPIDQQVNMTNNRPPCMCYSTNWNPVGSGILLVEIGIMICTGFKPV